MHYPALVWKTCRGSWVEPTLREGQEPWVVLGCALSSLNYTNCVCWEGLQGRAAAAPCSLRHPSGACAWLGHTLLPSLCQPAKDPFRYLQRQSIDQGGDGV